MEKRKLENEELRITPFSEVKVTTMNHIVEIQYLKNRNEKQHIQKLNAHQYLDLDTGEVKEFNKTVNRSQGVNSLRKTFKQLRELINTNFSGLPNELFVTLTYRGDLQTNDTKKVYSDFEKFMKRLKYYYKDTSSIDYINVLEPHASGNFHMHALLRFNDVPSIYIPNELLSEKWGNGFVTIQSLKNVDNIGAYVSAYLADVEIPDSEDITVGENIIEKEVQGGGKKKFVKGGRLHFYPTNVRIYRPSRGITKPVVEKMSYKQAKKKIGAATPTFVYGAEIIDTDANFRNTIIKEQYNSKRK